MEQPIEEVIIPGSIWKSVFPTVYLIPSAFLHVPFMELYLKVLSAMLKLIITSC